MKRIETNADLTTEEKEAGQESVKQKIVYVRFYPKGQAYISILKDDTLTEKAREQRAKNMEWASRNFEKYRKEVLKPSQQFDYLSEAPINDKFFLDEDEGEQEEEERPEVRRRTVDKRGNVLKN